MSSTFNGYNISTSGMYVNQAALTVVSNNLSNIDTTGYSRKQLTSEDQVIAGSGGTSTGSGVGVENITRARDTFLDQTYRQDNADSEYLNAKNNEFTQAQSLLNEYSTTSSGSTTGEDGVQQTIQTFFDSCNELAEDPSNQATRSTVVADAGSLVDTFNQINQQLTEMQQDAASQVQDGANSINTLAKQVATLNDQISQSETSGGEASDLRDQRDNLLDQLSALTNIAVTEQSNGADNVTIGGVALVQGDQAHAVSAVDDGTGLKLEWADLGSAVNISSGSVKAYLEEADQSAVTEISDSTVYNFTATGDSSLGTLRQGLNDLITTIANKVNDVLETGTDLEGNTGVALFTKIDANQSFTVGNIQVNPAITADVDKLATGTTGASGDGTLMTKITAVQDDSDFQYASTTMDLTSFYQSLTSWISTTGNTVSSDYDTQSTLLQQADNQRQSISSVSEDEEMSNMIAYQNAYEASARVLSLIDGLVFDLITDVGTSVADTT